MLSILGETRLTKVIIFTCLKVKCGHVIKDHFYISLQNTFGVGKRYPLNVGFNIIPFIFLLLFLILTIAQVVKETVNPANLIGYPPVTLKIITRSPGVGHSLLWRQNHEPGRPHPPQKGLGSTPPVPECID